MLKFIKNDQSLETELKLNDSSMVLSELLKEALQQSIMPSLKNENNNYLFSTLWTVINKNENRSVANVCFQGEPNEQGENEIGYGTYNQHQGKGYMTEAVQGMLNWAAKQEKVKAIIASTEKTNIASYIILEKMGLKKPVNLRSNLIGVCCWLDLSWQTDVILNSITLPKPPQHEG
jgi:ribosomal-protein-alanine N-acetyltransferase